MHAQIIHNLLGGLASAKRSDCCQDPYIRKFFCPDSYPPHPQEGGTFAPRDFIAPTLGENTGRKGLASQEEADTQVPQAETFSSAGELLVLEVDARSDHP